MPKSTTLKICFLVITCLIILLEFNPVKVISQDEFSPISIDTASQLQLLTTIENYKHINTFCACDVRFFSHDGRTIATDRKIVDLTTGTTIDLSDRGYPLTFNGQGTTAIISGQDHGTRLLDIATDTEQLLMPEDAEEAVFSPDGTLLVSSSRDADAVQVWNADDLSLVTTLGRSASYVRYMQLRFIADGKYLLWSDHNANLHLWDIETQDDWIIAENTWDYKLTDDETAIIINYDFIVTPRK